MNILYVTSPFMYLCRQPRAERTKRPLNSVASPGFKGALQKENYRLLSLFENFEAKRLDISFRFRQVVLEILSER